MSDQPFTKRQSCYFSHSRQAHGSPQTIHELWCLKQVFTRVEDPIALATQYRAKTGNSLGPGAYDMLRLDCTIMVVVLYEGKIGKGSYSDVSFAVARNIPVFLFEAVDETFKFFRIIEVRVINEASWAKGYAEVEKGDLYAEYPVHPGEGKG